MTVDEYIGNFPEQVAKRLETLRKIIREEAPGAVEGISYGMPGYKANGKPLVYFAAFKNHIGLYATPTGHAAFSEDLSKYRHGKGSVQFPLDMPLPEDLIRRIVRFRAAENQG